MTMKIAFSGTGHISRVHARAARTIAGLELAAVVNHRHESMAEFAAHFGISRQYAAVEGLLRAGDVDALVVGAPNYLHAPQTIAALEAGIHVMVEKPMAMNGAEAERMLASSEKSGAKLMVAHCWRFDEEVNWIKAQIDAGVLGKILRTKGCGVHVNWGPGGWFVESRYAGGGALADMGIHALDAARYLLGDPQPESVYAKLSTDYTDYDVDDSGTIWINWGGRRRVHRGIGLVVAPRRWTRSLHTALWQQGLRAAIPDPPGNPRSRGRAGSDNRPRFSASPR